MKTIFIEVGKYTINVGQISFISEDIEAFGKDEGQPVLNIYMSGAPALIGKDIELRGGDIGKFWEKWRNIKTDGADEGAIEVY